MSWNILRNYFVPHHGNNYHPHILHTKRAAFYSLVFLFFKVILVGLVFALPAEVFMLPDILAAETAKIAVLTNNYRQANERLNLKNDAQLKSSAIAKASDMATNHYFSHTGPDGKKVSDLVRATGYHYTVVGENLAVGYATAEEVVKAWQKSPTHNANLLDSDFVDLGVSMELGEYKGELMVFAVQHFGARLVEEVEEILVSVTSPTPLTVYNQNKITTTPKVLTKPKPQAMEKATVVTSSTVTTSIISANSIPNQKVVVSADTIVGQPYWHDPVQKYLGAKKLSPLRSVFDFSKNIYLFAIVFFSLALCLSIVIEFKKQHPHIIMQTAGLIGLLVVLFVI